MVITLKNSLCANSYLSVCNFLSIKEAQKLALATKKFLPLVSSVIYFYSEQIKRRLENLSLEIEVEPINITPLLGIKSLKQLNRVNAIVTSFFMFQFIKKPQSWELPKKITIPFEVSQAYIHAQQAKELLGQPEEPGKLRKLLIFIHSLVNESCEEEAFGFVNALYQTEKRQFQAIAVAKFVAKIVELLFKSGDFDRAFNIALRIKLPELREEIITNLCKEAQKLNILLKKINLLPFLKNREKDYVLWKIAFISLRSGQIEQSKVFVERITNETFKKQALDDFAHFITKQKKLDEQQP